MRSIARLGTTAAAGALVVLATATTASAAEAVMDNDYTSGHTVGYCTGNVVMNYFYTVRPDVQWATYYDEYWSSSQGRWIAASAGMRLNDSWAAGQTMVTNLRAGTPVDVVADQLVYTRQGNQCQQGVQ